MPRSSTSFPARPTEWAGFWPDLWLTRNNPICAAGNSNDTFSPQFTAHGPQSSGRRFIVFWGRAPTFIQAAVDWQLWTGDRGPATVDCGLVIGAVPFLVAGLLRVRLHGRQLSERVHPPDAAGDEHRHAAVALPALPVLHPVVSQRPAGHVAGPARPVQKLRRADFTALLHRGTADGRDFFELLAGFRQRVTDPRHPLHHFSRRPDCGHVH